VPTLPILAERVFKLWVIIARYFKLLGQKLRNYTDDDNKTAQTERLALSACRDLFLGTQGTFPQQKKRRLHNDGKRRIGQFEITTENY
jgi:hypothetical protein